jgi:DNA helicase-2/ATP-dependent DNA helicase PcrA
MAEDEGLNPEQAQTVELCLEPVLVLAPVGTGKTRTLALRAGRAVEMGLEARSLLCLSFTNKAAREMKERLTRLYGKTAGEVTTRTFHGLCASMLRTEAGTVGLDGDFVIYDEEDVTELIGRLLRAKGIYVDAREAERVHFALFEASSRARLAKYEERPGRPAEVFARTLSESNTSRAAFRGLDPASWLRDYVHELRENHAVDFADLQLGVLRLFAENGAALARWQSRFTWIQVDEVQDTSLAEYAILGALGRPHGQLSFFGDVDQTIYEWRGSAPARVLERYRRDFHPREIRLTRNYRSTKAILDACVAVVRHCPGAVTESIVAQQADPGVPVVVKELANPAEEARWIAGQIRTLREDHKLGWRDCAVLVRTNFTARDLSSHLTQLRIPHLEVEQQKFFQRVEIKTAIAYLRLLQNRHDGNSLDRYLRTPAKGIGEATLKQLCGAPRQAGLKLGDLLDARTLERGDPFAALLDALARDQVVVFDTETTGLDAEQDEIVEIAAARCGREGTRERFHAFLRPSRPVGESERIHGWSDEFLQANGRPARGVLDEFRAFCDGTVLAGHNVLSFDMPILRSCARRCGAAGWEGLDTFDTLDLTRRFHRLPRYRLSTIAEALGLRVMPTHKAEDDVETTVELLLALAGLLEQGAAARYAAVRDVRDRFASLAHQYERWAERMKRERPHELAQRVLEESGLVEHFRREADGLKRITHLEEFCRLLALNDDPALPPSAALATALNLAALGSDVERQAAEEDRVLLLTAHQSKGLEFDTVFIANAVDDEFPSYRSKREGRYDEEHRLFYVAMSRARRHLFFSWPRVDQYGRRRLPSPYLDLLKDATRRN